MMQLSLILFYFNGSNFISIIIASQIRMHNNQELDLPEKL